MAWVGYARVSSVGQNLEVQRDTLQPCDKLFQETQAARRGPVPNSARAWIMCGKAIRSW